MHLAVRRRTLKGSAQLTQHRFKSQVPQACKASQQHWCHANAHCKIQFTNLSTALGLAIARAAGAAARQAVMAASPQMQMAAGMKQASARAACSQATGFQHLAWRSGTFETSVPTLQGRVACAAAAPPAAPSSAGPAAVSSASKQSEPCPPLRHILAVDPDMAGALVVLQCAVQEDGACEHDGPVQHKARATSLRGAELFWP